MTIMTTSYQNIIRKRVLRYAASHTTAIEKWPRHIREKYYNAMTPVGQVFAT